MTTMPLPPSALLAYQHDIHIRYAFLARLVHSVLLREGNAPAEDAAPLRILDIGCGPERLTEAFLPPGVEIVRADVDRFGDESMVLLVPGEPLPFDDGAFDAVLAMDVLEHVPAEGRAALLAELQRVATRAVILCCPTNDPAVVATELEFQGVVRHLTGHSLPFLDEHAGLGLPAVDGVLASFAPDWTAVAIENAPLDHWILFNIVDFLYAKDIGDTPEKHAFNTAVNADSRFRIPGRLHYRRFFCALRDTADLTALDAYLRSPEMTTDDDGSDALHALARHLPILRDDLRRSLEQAVAMKDAYVAQQSSHIETLTRLLTTPTNQDIADRFDAKIEAVSHRLTELSERTDARLDNVAGQVGTLSHGLGVLSQEVGAQAERTNARIDLLARQADDLQELLRVIEANTRRKENPLLRLLKPSTWRNRDYGAIRRAWRAKAAEAVRAGRAMAPLLQPTLRMGVRSRFHLARTIRFLNTTLLFRHDYYSAQNPDVTASRIPPLLHYAVHGWREGRRPNPYFDPAFYLNSNPDVAATGIEPLTHYAQHGWREGRRPSPQFDPSLYLQNNPDVATSGIEPLTHYVQHGCQEGRRTGLEQEAPAGERVNRAANGAPDAAYTPPVGLLPWFSPLNLRTDPSLSDSPHLNVLVPGLAMKHMSGGPNTAVNLAYRLAALGVSVRFVATDAPLDPDPAPFWRHVRSLSGIDRALPNATLVDASDRSKPLPIGANDVFMATAWWTAQMAKYALGKTNHKRFVYLIQDYEPLLHPASTQSALAEETYALDHIPVTNTSLLKEFLAERKIGQHADPAFSARTIVFEPAVDQARFHAVEKTGPRRTLLFYARPTNGLRNLFEMGVAALQKAIHDGVLDPAAWDFLGMGENFAPVSLGGGAWLKPAPWLDFDGYARQMRESDILLSLMLSPHPSYPPIEMALCGKPAVTTVFANKTAERLAELSPNIIGVTPTVEGIADGLAEAWRRLDTGTCRRDPHGLYPGDWDTSFQDAVPRLFEELLALFGAPRLPDHARLGRETLFPGYRSWPTSVYELQRFAALRGRAAAYAAPEPGLLSILTPVWNTDPIQLAELAESVFGQDIGDGAVGADGPGFEWVILDNNSDREETRVLLARLAQHPCVRLYRSDENLGIIRGTRFCLERARNRYVATLDHDDLLTPDCVRVVTAALKAAGYPALSYSDEDKILGDRFRDPYCKPDWDPVLFANSCYIAHMLCIDRKQALTLDAYGDPQTEGSHDWDTFTRFHRAGHTPVHIPEILYTWRMHEQSTALNIHSKSYIATSHRAVLERFLGDRNGHYTIEPSPLFENTPDWMFKRTHEAPQPVTTVILHAGGQVPAPTLDPAIPHEVSRLAPDATLADLLDIARACAERGALVHLLWAGVEAEGDEWPWQAMTCFELFPDTVMVGGRIRRGDGIVAAGAYLGFGRGCDSPDVGRRLCDPGYFAQMFKMRSVSAVPVQHCVVSATFLAEVLPALTRAGVGFAHLGAWLGAAARERDRRVVYSPFLLGRTDGTAAGRSADPDRLVPEAERVAFRIAYGGMMPERRLLSPHLGLTPETAYRPVRSDERQRQEERARAPGAASYPDEAEGAAIARLLRHAPPAQAPSMAILTSVYEKTPVDAFRDLARSLFEQTVPFTEWVLLRNGPVPASLDTVLEELDAEPRVRLLSVRDNLGIIGAMRHCLEKATADWIVPMDADDLLSKDALQQIAAEIAASAPALVYSDEDILRAGVLESPFRRPAFDPILNTADSYIWHLCAFRRDTALSLGVYSDKGAEFCHDWDTVSRFAMAGAAIAHVPEILYHWRVHETSNSNSGTANTGSRRSAEWVMARSIAAQAKPDLYEIGAFPLFRGQEQSAILRRRAAPLPMEAVVLVPGAGESGHEGILGADASGLCRSVHVLPNAGADGSLDRLAAALDRLSAAHVMVLRAGLRVDDAGLWEAMRLFEMHPDVALVGGRVLDGGDRVVESCAIAGPGHEVRTPWLGLGRNDPGAFAMALKPQSVAAVPAGFFFAEVAFLRGALRNGVAPGLRAADLGRIASDAARRQKRRVAYSPLVEARPAGP